MVNSSLEASLCSVSAWFLLIFDPSVRVCVTLRLYIIMFICDGLMVLTLRVKVDHFVVT